jgi:serine/threonine-protein phosphatase CPPED1
VKRFLLAIAAVVVLTAAVAFSNVVPPSVTSFLQVKVEDRNPWSNLRVNNDPEDFQFVIVSDRTGGHREKVFSRAVEQINLMQPEFVVSVGDLIEGYSDKPERLEAEWREFQGYVAKLKMPFFYVPGNHDIANKVQEKLWQDKFGRRYFHFVYKNVLFLLLCSEDPPGSSAISPDQLAYVKKALEDNPNVRWTVVALHKPIWAAANLEKNGWLEVEKLLNGRKYTAFAGHVHRYQKFVRNGMNHYQLATTGGGSRLRGVRYGEFDHVVWVTMKKDGPVLANIMLDGILPENLERPASDEPGVAREVKPTQPVKGKVYLDGTPAVGATVVFQSKSAEARRGVRGDAVVEGDGSFVLSTYGAFDGAPVGDYAVTVTLREPPDLQGKSGPNQLPEKYASPDTSGLTATVKAGVNEFTFELKTEEAKPVVTPPAEPKGK